MTVMRRSDMANISYDVERLLRLSPFVSYIFLFLKNRELTTKIEDHKNLLFVVRTSLWM